MSEEWRSLIWIVIMAGLVKTEPPSCAWAVPGGCQPDDWLASSLIYISPCVVTRSIILFYSSFLFTTQIYLINSTTKTSLHATLLPHSAQPIPSWRIRAEIAGTKAKSPSTKIASRTNQYLFSCLEILIRMRLKAWRFAILDKIWALGRLMFRGDGSTSGIRKG